MFKMIITGIALITLSVTSVKAEETPAPKLDDLVTELLTNNPEVRASKAHGVMLANKVKQAGSLEDPMLMLKIQNGLITDPLNFSKDGMTQKVIGISQQLPYFGKRQLRKEVAKWDAESAHLVREEQTVELVRMLRETYYQLYAVDKSLQITDRNISILDTFVSLAETRYKVGQGSQQDIFKAQVEHSKLLDMKLTLEQQRTSLAIRLNSLLYRPVTTPVGTIPEFELSPLPAETVSLARQAEEQSPLIRSLTAQIEKGKAGEALARREFMPDFNVFFEYMQRQPAPGSNGDDMYTLGFSVNLPLQRERRHAMVAEATSEAAMAAEELKDVRNSISAGIADLTSQMSRRRQQVELYRTGIIPQAEQALESAIIGYQVGKVDFLALLDSRMTLYTYERELYEARADYQMKLIQIEALVGSGPETGNQGQPRRLHKPVEADSGKN